MIPLTGAELLAALDGRAVSIAADGALLDRPLLQVMTDSRIPSTDPAAFFALRTDRADGHDHLASAAAAGAVVAVVDHPREGAPLPQIVVDDTWAALGVLGRHVLDRVGCRVVAVTGSFGKTTVKDLAAAALAGARRVAHAHGSFNNELGVPLTMLAVRSDTEVLVAEAGARLAGDIALLGELLRPDVAVVTAVGPVHLETFGDEAGVAAEKSRLVSALRPSGTAVLNVDDPRVAAMGVLAPSVVTVSAGGAVADVIAEAVTVDTDGRARGRVRSPWGSVELAPPLPGRHHLTNALLALAVAGVEGVDLDRAAEGIAVAPTSPSRSALRQVGGVTVLDDAYNASPPTVLGALETLASLPCTGRRWAVLGTMAELGAVSEAQHLAVGRAAAALDELVVVGERAEPIARGAADAGGRARITMVTDHDAAADLLIGQVRAGDVVLFKASRVATLDRAAARVVAALEGGGDR